MGLDQYGYYCDPTAVKSEVDFDTPEGAKQFFYWRKHPNLQGWMSQLYAKKGGTKDFNCVNVQLNEADLAQLELDIMRLALPSTKGFFFGSDKDIDEQEEDLKFVREAREMIANGKLVFYTSWW